MSSFAAASTAAVKTISRQRKDLILLENLHLLKKRILILTQCDNFNAKELDELRTTLAKSNVQVKYLKTSVFRRALQDSQYPELLDVVSGPIIAWSSDQEPGETGKALISAVKGKRRINFLAGKIEDRVWTHEGCSEILQNLSKKTDIQAQLLGLLQAPAASLNRTLNQVPSALASIINIQSKKAE
jgi:ribosomal protein L10